MTPERYLADRIEQNIKWYDGKAVIMKSRYLHMRAFAVVAGGLVPVLVNIPWKFTVFDVPVINVITTLVSLAVVVIVSLESVYHYREQWKNYRSTEQLLRHEKFLFTSRVGIYRGLPDEDAFRLLVERVEEAIAIENSATLNVMTMAAEIADAKKSTSGQALPQPKP